MFNATYETAQEAFEELYDEIMAKGRDTNIGTRALYNVGITILCPNDREISTTWRKWNPRYASREWDWYQSKNRSVEEIKKFAPMWDKMHGGDNIVNSNYGWQLSRNDQLEKVIEQLQKDPNTRQAWVTIYDGKEKDDYAFDTPCTLNIGFSILPGTKQLDMTVLMRSNDLVYGFCNDQYCFSKWQEEIAKRLNLAVGTYYHYAHDMHIYKRHFDLKQKNK